MVPRSSYMQASWDTAWLQGVGLQRRGIYGGSTPIVDGREQHRNTAVSLEKNAEYS